MPSGTLLLSTVPSGRDSKGGLVVTVHVSPQLDSSQSPAILSTWTSDVKNGVVQFVLAWKTSGGQSSLPITPTGSLLKPDLWPRFFENGIATFSPAVMKAQNPAAAAKQTLEIDHNGVRLQGVVNNATAFYQAYTTKVPINAGGIAQLRNKAVDFARQHSVYALQLQDVSDPGTDARTYLQGKVGQDLVATRVFGNIDVDAAFPPQSKKRASGPQVLILNSLIQEIDHMNHNQSGQPGAPPASPNSHIIHHIHRMRSVSRKTPANISPSSVPSNPSQPVPMSFSQRISMLQNMPAFMEALGLVVEFVIPASALPVTNITQLQVQIVGNTYSGLNVVNPWTALNPTLFLPQPGSDATRHPNPLVSSNGFVDVGTGYFFADIQPESATQQIFSFANRAALALNANPNDPTSAVTQQINEDYKHPVLPHSPHTDGIYVYQDDRQKKTKDKYDYQQSSPPPPVLYAEDLFQSFAVDIKPDNGGWSHLTFRSEEYYDRKSHQVMIPLQWREHGVRTSATRPTDTIPAPVGSSPPEQNYVVDEALFTWRRGSLAIKGETDSTGPLPSKPKSDTEQLSVQAIPWINDFVGAFTPPRDIPPQRFGRTYDFALRPVYLTGRTRLFDPSEAEKSTVPNTGPFLRNEMVLGPQLIIKVMPDAPSASTRSLMFVASHVTHPQGQSVKSKTPKLDASPKIPLSIRYLVPSPTTPSVARRHGMSESDIKQGATTIPLTKGGALPPQLPLPPDQIDTSTPYVPDPMCDGVHARLLFVGNTPMPNRPPTVPVNVKFYPGVRKWPQYALHCVELRAGAAGTQPKLSVEYADLGFQHNNPGTSNESQIIVCELPPGMNAVMELIPTILDSERDVHAFKPVSQPGVPTLPLERTNVCRPTILRLVHATDIPVVIPEATLSGTEQESDAGGDSQVFSFDRNANPRPTVTENYEPYTTGIVTMNASWVDQIDDLQKAGPEERATSAAFYSRHLPKVWEGSSAENIGPTIASPPSPPVTLPFSDSLYRRVTLQTSGVSRYTGVFGNDNRTVSQDVTCDFLSTASPPAPDIEYILPTFEWTFGRDSQKRKCGLAVMLNRPWYASGAGEQLAVILPPGSKGKSARLPAQSPNAPGSSYGIENQVTAWGSHAIWLPAESTDMYIDLMLPGQCIPVSSGGQTQTIAAFDPVFDEVEGRWFCNLSFSDPPVYGVLARLVLARYQSMSIAGMALSNPVVTDFALLGPSRLLQIKRSLSSVQVTISGVGAYDPSGALQTIFDVVVASEEDGDETQFAWREPAKPWGDSTSNRSSAILWRGTLDYDWAKTNMLIVREYETHGSFEKGATENTRRRLVYSSSFPL